MQEGPQQRPSSSTPTELFATEHNCRRITPADIRNVTPEDIEATLKSMTREEYRVALRVMVNNNKIGDVLTNTEPETFVKALGALDEEMVKDAGQKAHHSPPFQASLLAGTTDAIRAACASALQHLSRVSGKTDFL